ncbi:MAG: DUF1232 domain-containing protein [Chitinophagaceae bacterium]|nr:DUF1232 domain-containing protein [Anaerolineae bacterium]
MFQKLKPLIRQFKDELNVYRLFLKHDNTPGLARVLLGAAIAYFVSPIDLIPDAIPVLGQLDDLLIVPGLVALALRMVPKEVMEECRLKVKSGDISENPR